MCAAGGVRAALIRRWASVALVTLALAPAFLGGGKASAREDLTPGLADSGVAGTISTAVGGIGGPSAATAVGLTPGAVSYAAGQLYVSDQKAVRAVDEATGELTTVAGTGGVEPLGDGGPAASASVVWVSRPPGFGVASGTVTDASGNLLIADPWHHRVRAVAASTGTF